MLTDTKVRGLKPRDRAYRMSDEKGLYVEVAPTGSRYWRWKYRFGGKEKRLAFGVYPEVGLGEARDRRDEARALLRAGQDPSSTRRQARRDAASRSANSFEAVARDWIEVHRAKWTADYLDKVVRSLERDVFPTLGHRPIAEIVPSELLTCLKAVERRGALDMAGRVCQRCSCVFRHGIITDRCAQNPASEVRGAIKSRPTQHRAALSATDIPDFLRRLDAYDGEPETRLAVRLLMLTFVRTGELRGARWEEIDFERAVWRIPAERMKSRDPHIVPLAPQVLDTLRELRALTGESSLVLPGRNDPRKPMSENTVLCALYRMGYHGRTTGHGFRALASTTLNELGWSPDIIERQLAHVERNRVRAAYNRAQYLAERTKMMAAWADFVEAQGATRKGALGHRAR